MEECLPDAHLMETSHILDMQGMVTTGGKRERERERVSE